jgi:hypothetical protein
MSVLTGDLVRVYIDGTAVAYATSATINLQTELDKIAPTSAGAASFTVVKPRRKSGNININALYGTATNYDFKDLYDAWEAGTAITVVWKYASAGEWQVSSSAYSTAISGTAAVNQDVTKRATITFSGATSIATIT